MGKFFFITSTLPRIHGGRTKSLLQRAFLLNKSNVALTIVSTNYNSEYQDIYNFYYGKNKILKNTRFENIYDYYKNKYFVKNEKQSWKILFNNNVKNIDNYVRVKRSKKSNRTYFYDGGIPKVVIKQAKNENVPVFFALYHEWNFNPYKIFNINKDGVVHRIDTYDEKNVMILQEFLLDSGDIYLTKKFSHNKLKTIILNDHGNLIQFDSEKKWIAHFFNEIFTSEDVIINDARLLDIPLLETNVKKRIFQLHSSHLSDPLDNQSSIKKSYANILNTNFPNNDIIVSLTEQQKQDILSKLPNLKDNIRVIPHSITTKQLQYKKSKNHFGIVSRLDAGKNIEDAINAFKLFNQEIPNYILDIYGDGERRNRLMELTKALNLEDSVIFHGNVDNVDEAYQKIYALLITSNFEGFALMALESISNGTPVVTYEVKYGPTDIIDSTSGWVTKFRTPDSLKEEMIYAIKEPKNPTQVQKRALIFSEEIFVDRWLEVLEING
ncbi:glycosyltransferase [Weissella hellenica]|nr:glycosyltransferase [Weissella hellenica]